MCESNIKSSWKDNNNNNNNPKREVFGTKRGGGVQSGVLLLLLNRKAIPTQVRQCLYRPPSTGKSHFHKLF